MPQEPKRRHSRQRKGKRRASISLATVRPNKCPNCGNYYMAHHICKGCGYYKGKPIIVKKEKKAKEKK